MHAWLCETLDGVNALQWRELPTPEPKPGEERLAIKAASTVDHATDAAERARVVSGAKVKIADAARQVSQEAVQLHGGMGMSDELNVGHYFKRIASINIQFGDPTYHLLRYARAN